MAFGKSLHRWRKAKGLTQQELATAVGVNVSYISNLERDFSATTKSGKPRPSEDLCKRFARVLEVPLDEVRLDAGYAPLNDRPLFPIGFDAAVKLGTNVSPDERQEIAEELALAYEVIMARRRRRLAQNESTAGE